jgi:hypothetical protein
MQLAEMLDSRLFFLLVFKEAVGFWQAWCFLVVHSQRVHLLEALFLYFRVTVAFLHLHAARGATSCTPPWWLVLPLLTRLLVVLLCLVESGQILIHIIGLIESLKLWLLNGRDSMLLQVDDRRFLIRLLLPCVFFNRWIRWMVPETSLANVYFRSSRLVRYHIRLAQRLHFTLAFVLGASLCSVVFTGVDCVE